MSSLLWLNTLRGPCVSEGVSRFQQLQRLRFSLRIHQLHDGRGHIQFLLFPWDFTALVSAVFKAFQLCCWRDVWKLSATMAVMKHKDRWWKMNTWIQNCRKRPHDLTWTFHVSLITAALLLKIRNNWAVLIKYSTSASARPDLLPSNFIFHN